MNPSDIAALLSCAICSKQLSSPSTLRCGHTICSNHNSCTLNHGSYTLGHIQSDKKLDVSLSKIIDLVNRHMPSASRSRREEDDAEDDDQDGGDERPAKRARLALPADEDDDDDDDDGDLLSHLRSESARQRTVRHDQPLLPSEPEPHTRDASFKKDLLTELSCEICLSLLYEPVTTPCQHTFCSRCLARSLDHSSVCPLCRQQLPGFAYFQNHPPNQVMLRIILHACGSAYEERGAAIETEEHNERLNTPIFVCQLSFPGMPTLLHFFEPKYRLMLRRCLASRWPAFGMIMSSPASTSSSSSNNMNSSDQIEYGTMLEIRSVQMLPDGRSMVETWGAWRFRILERGLMDGYVVGRIERIDDIPDESDDGEEIEETVPVAAAETSTSRPSALQRLASRLTGTSTSNLPGSSSSSSPITPGSSSSDTDTLTSAPLPEPTRLLPLSTLQLIEHCTSFLSQLHTEASPWVGQRLNYTHGPPPPLDPRDPSFDIGTFTFYVAMILPIDEWEKAKLLPLRSTKMRLKMLVYWIEGLRQNWWFERGCVVL